MINNMKFTLFAAAVAMVGFTSSGFAQSPNNIQDPSRPQYPLGHSLGYPNLQEGSGSAASRFQKQNGYYAVDESPETKQITQNGAGLYSYAGPRRNAHKLHSK